MHFRQIFITFVRTKQETMNPFTSIIARQLGLPDHAVENTLALLDQGCSIPFIARYRKERTGGLNEVQIGSIAEWNDRLHELARRKDSVCKTIDGQGRLTPELKERIDACWDANELEDLYLPYRPKRRTRAQVARERGLEPLAKLVQAQRETDVEATAMRFLTDEVPTVEEALAGAKDIIAEGVSENARSRQSLRNTFLRSARITSRVVKTKRDDDAAAKYADYFDFDEPLRRCSGNRFLAMRRGQDEGFLRLKLSIDDDEAVSRLCRHYVRGHGSCSQLVAEAVEDAYQRLLEPSIENEVMGLTKEKADEEAIRVFADNLRQLLLAPPLGQRAVMAIDPGFRTGCKVVCLDAQGNLLHHEAIYPHPPQRWRMQAAATVTGLISQYHVEAIAIGNGTASRETREFVDDVIFELKKRQADGVPRVFVVSEDGASIYSASQVARDEFPDEDVTVRGAVSIGRRLMDPLSELVKIDPKSIGVGQYQHDVNQTLLKHSLDQTVESCVNLVGVNVNTASRHLLAYVSGLGSALAKNIVDYRREHGAFRSRAELRKVPRLGPSAYEQCAGFLRIPHAANPLDASAVHPESYAVVERMAHDQGCTVAELMKDKRKQQAIRLQDYVTDTVGLPTLTDIIHELDKPGLDPRDEIETFDFDPRVHTIGDLEEGMELPGIVTNITKFGAFVDIGVHQDGLVHVSQLADHYVSDPARVVKLHQHVRVRVLQVDDRRHRISLSMRGSE